MSNLAGAWSGCALVLVLALAAPAGAQESPGDAYPTLVTAIRAFHDGLLAAEPERHVAALEGILPTRDDLDVILGDLAGPGWRLIEGWRRKVLENAELVAHEISLSGAPREIEIIDMRTRPESHLTAALAVVPPEIPVCSARTTYEKSSGSSGVYFQVNDRWVWVRGFEALVPKLVDQRAAGKARVSAILNRISEEWTRVLAEVEIDVDPEVPVDADRVRQDQIVHVAHELCVTGELGELYDEFIHPHIKLQIVASMVTEDDLAAGVPEDSTELLAAVRQVLVERRRRGAERVDALGALLERFMATNVAGLADRARRAFVNHLTSTDLARLTELLARIEAAIPLVSTDSEKLRCLQRVVPSPPGHSTEYVLARESEDQLWHLELGYLDDRWMIYDYD